MEHTPDAFADALASGDPDRVNRAIDAVENMELEERAAHFDDCFEVCRDVYENGDGYQRQSAIRFADALYPRLVYRTVGEEYTDDALPEAFTVEETAMHRERLRELYLDALVDDDGRVRRAAAKAIKDLARTAEMIESDDEMQGMLEAPESLAADHPESKTKHIEEAHQNVAFHADKPASLLPDELQGVVDQYDPAQSNERLERYRRYREIGQELNSKILDECVDREAIRESARLLGFYSGDGPIVYETESDMTVHQEFVVNEYRQKDHTAVEQYFEEERWDTEAERAILEALLVAETSLFEITAIDETDKELIVTDLLDDDDEFRVTDVNLSGTAEPGFLLFFRPLQYEEFNTTSGVSFPFPPDEKDRVLDEFADRAENVDAQTDSVRRFVTFFDLYREYGIHIHYL